MERDAAPSEVLRSQRAATRFQILAEIADHQPAVSQREIADAIGITTQAVSEHLRHLDEERRVRMLGRGRYEITKEGVDWLLSQTESLDEYLTHVNEDVLGSVDYETAIATATIEQGDPVSLSMVDGRLEASPDPSDETASAVAVTSAEAGADVGVAEWDGVIDYQLGSVVIVAVPDVRSGGSQAVTGEMITDSIAEADIIVAAGTEAIVTLERFDSEPHVTFGTAGVVQEAAARGLDVLLVCVETEVSEHIESLRELDIPYQLVETDQ